MAIKSNKKIDFEYEHENDGDTYAIALRLHNSTEYGASIGVLDENGEVAINFPVSMFPEITDFLVDQGIIEGKKSITTPPVKMPKINKPVATTKPVTLPKPRLTSQRQTVNPLMTSASKGREVISVNLEDDTGDEYADLPEEIREKLARESDRIQNIQSAVEGSSPAMSLSESATQLELSEEEAANILQEREAAAKRAQNSIKKIRKKSNDE
jgi:hypothetical protein